MIRIAITVEAFDAIVATLPLGSMGYVNSSPYMVSASRRVLPSVVCR